MIVSPSILSSDFSKLGEEIERLDKSLAEYIHIDVMDGMFVKNITIGPSVISSIRKFSKKVFDVHLMIESPIRYIEDFIKAGSDIITFHIDSCKDDEEVLKTIELIKKHGVKCGITLKPSSDYKRYEPFLKLVDLALVMSVEPGFGGQSFMNSSLEVIKYLDDYRKVNSCNYLINVDGGINFDTSKLVRDAGVDIVVAGSYIYKNDFNDKIKELSELWKH